MEIEIRNVSVSRENGTNKKVWDYQLSINGREYTLDADRSLTLDEIKGWVDANTSN